MKQNNVFTRLANFINRIIIAIYRYFRKKPSTTIDFVRWWGAGGKFRLENMPAWKKTVSIDRFIDGFIDKYGIAEYQKKSLYKLDETDLQTCFLAARLNLLKPDDFSFAAPISMVFSKDELLTNHLPDHTDFFGKWLRNDDLLHAARSVATTEDEFKNIRIALASYKSSIDINRYFTDKIQKKLNFFSIYGITLYMGQDLYSIDSEVKLNEAFDAFTNIRDLKAYHFVTSYEGIPVNDLSKFLSRKCLVMIELGKSKNMVIDEAAKTEQEEKDKVIAAMVAQRKATSKAYREKKKAEKEAELKKAAKPAKKATAPVKKIQPKKAKKKAS